MPDMSYLKVGDTSYKVKDITAQNDISDLKSALNNFKTEQTAYNGSVNNLISVDNIVRESFFDDLETQKGEHKFLHCIKENVDSMDNYGADKTKYLIQYTPTDKIHVCYDFRFTEPLRYAGSNITVQLLYDVRTGFNPYLTLQGAEYSSGNIIRRVYVRGTSNDYLLDVENSVFNGETAFYLVYTGEYEGAKIKVTASGLQIVKADNTVIHTVSYTDNDSVNSLIAQLNALEDITAVAKDVTGHTCEDLMLFSGMTIPLTLSEELSGQETSVVTKPRIYIPYVFDAKWHTFEAIVDVTSGIVAFSIDGYTMHKSISAPSSADYRLVIGGTTKVSSQILIKNLQIDIDSLGDAELIDSIAYPFVNKSEKQLISSRNPRVLIFEGHGIHVGTDADANIPDMAVSTDRLYNIFATLMDKGYKHISFNEFTDWKMKGTPIPKRSYMFIFDDYRIENYIDYNKRLPFIKNGATCGLAIITDYYDASQTFTVNSITYTRDQIFKILFINGWYAMSHTRNHRNITSVTTVDSVSEFEQDVLSADMLGIHSNILVYPSGDIRKRYMPILEDSGFMFGIMTVKSAYNYICKATNRFLLGRVDIRSSYALDDVLSQIT